ncbi:hypothetical protein GF343_03310 [Candidatus Woesearchaeota archaeon]|nr:hypothetical protein [Candidatus Woesearchaeota archaeon]
MALVQDVIAFLGRLGLWDVVLPFILVFTVTYAILERTKVLGADPDGTPKHRFNAMLAVVTGFIVLIAVDTLNVINVFSEMIVILILVAVCIAVIFGFFGFQEFHKKWYFMAIAVLVFGTASLYVLGVFDYLDWNALRRYEGVIVGLIIFFLILWIILRKGKKELTEEEKKKSKKKKAEEKKKRGAEEEKEQEPEGGSSPVDLDKFLSGLSENAKREILSGVMQHPAAASGKFTVKDMNEVIKNLSKETIQELMAKGQVR